MSNLIEIQNLSKSYRIAEDSLPRSVLKDLYLSLNEGESLAILGPSGSGKSTLLNLIGALDVPDSGTLLFNGKNILDMNKKEKDVFRNRQVGFVFQQHHLLPQHSVWENVMIPLLANPTGKHKRTEVIDWGLHLLDACDMVDRRHQRPGQLSGGECLRAALLRALINKPALLLADEPTGSLDRTTAESVGDLLVRLNKELNLALIIVTHADFIADKMNRKLFLENGKLYSHA
jgi:ABC-type lipoprotein export system ATPase subunit